MNSEVFEVLNLLEKERDIPVGFMLGKIKEAILTVCKNSYSNEDVLINMDAARDNFEVFLCKMVVEQVEDPGKEILLAQVRKIDPSTGLEDRINVALNTEELGGIAAQAIRNIIRQGIRGNGRDQMIQEFQSKNQELVTALVGRVGPRSGAATLKIDKIEAVLPKGEQVGDEQLREGGHTRAHVVDIKKTEKGPRAMTSCTRPNLVRHLFETEVPEIYDGVVEIEAVSREAGSRIKLAVISHNPDADAISMCINTRGARVSNTVTELGGKKIDIVKYSNDLAQFIASALSPADVLSVQVAEDGSRVRRVTVPDSQFSLAVGNKGRSARLVAKLTG